MIGSRRSRHLVKASIPYPGPQHAGTSLQLHDIDDDAQQFLMAVADLVRRVGRRCGIPGVSVETDRLVATITARLDDAEVLAMVNLVEKTIPGVVVEVVRKGQKT